MPREVKTNGWFTNKDDEDSEDAYSESMGPNEGDTFENRLVRITTDLHQANKAKLKIL